ncbi:MAG TPA: DUF3237 family protein [Chloroflexota bacterium]|nr:DUF3237 family protein [Chloroflexota bacterium]
MDLVPLADLELRYTALEMVDYGAGGQIYGTMEGTLSGETIDGDLHLTNLAARRPDNVNLPTLRGLLTTHDGATVYVELAGIATLRPADGARVFVTAMTFRTGDSRYDWLNTVFGLVEGVLDAIMVGGVARARVYRCKPTIGLPA